MDEEEVPTKRAIAELERALEASTSEKKDRHIRNAAEILDDVLF